MTEKKLYDVVKGAKDMRQARCQVCKGLVVQVPDGKGGSIFQCQTCHRRFSNTKL